MIIGDADLVPAWPGAGWLIVLALTSQVLGWLLITTSLPRLPAALTSLLLTVQPVGSVALGAMIFGEAPSSLQLVGVAIVLARSCRRRGRASARVGAARSSAAAAILDAESAALSRLPEQILGLRADDRRGPGAVLGA